MKAGILKENEGAQVNTVHANYCLSCFTLLFLGGRGVFGCLDFFIF